MCILNGYEVHLYDYSYAGIKGYSKALRDLLSIHRDTYNIVVEDVHSYSAQGVKSVFSFGQRLGEIEGMLQTLELTYSKVSPKTWQKKLDIEPKSGKKGIYEKISTFYPDVVLTGPRGGILDGRCDALSMAYYLKLKEVQ